MGAAQPVWSSEESPKLPSSDHAALMDRVYRGQRIIYDLTRKYFLFGRDTLLRTMKPRSGARVLEVGVGTARNLVLLARLYPNTQLYGLDASKEMLLSAGAKVEKFGLSNRITLRHGLAEECDPQLTFGLAGRFDVVFFSYALSMIPDWRAALDRAYANVQRGGVLYVVDFWDQRTYPRMFQRALRSWLARFHVRFRPEHIEYLRQLAERNGGKLTLRGVGGSYAYIAALTRAQ